MNITVLGAGKLGTTIIRGLLDAGVVDAAQLRATVHREQSTERVHGELGIACGRDNVAAVADADVILLCVKPQIATAVLDEIGPAARGDALLISTAAGLGSAAISAALGSRLPVMRAMPNTPSQVGAGMTVLSPGEGVSDDQLKIAGRLFEAVGRVRVLDEKHMDAVTALSASGAAFVYVILESLAEGGVKVGLPREIATELAAQTMLGASRMVLETGAHPALLKDAVTTPAGCTIDGLLELEAGGLRVTLIKAVVEAARRAARLA